MITKQTRQYLSWLRSKYIDKAGKGGFQNVKYYYINNLQNIEYCVRGKWQLWTAEYFNSNNINWERNKLLHYKKSDNIIHTYNPDFYLSDLNIYVEVKGYFFDKDKEKMKYVLEQNDVRILWIDSNIIKSIKNKEQIFEDIPFYNDISSIVCNKQNLIQENLVIEKPYHKYICQYCKNEFKSNQRKSLCHHKFCSTDCFKKYNQQKSKCPNKDILIQQLEKYNLQQVGKHFNVSSNTIRKWCKKYNIDFKQYIYSKHNLIEFNNSKYTLTQLSKLLNLSNSTILRRLSSNIPLDKQLKIPSTYQLNGIMYTISELSKLSGVQGKTIRRRIQRGLSIQQSIKN